MDHGWCQPNSDQSFLPTSHALQQVMLMALNLGTLSKENCRLHFHNSIGALTFLSPDFRNGPIFQSNKEPTDGYLNVN